VGFAHLAGPFPSIDSETVGSVGRDVVEVEPDPVATASAASSPTVTVVRGTDPDLPRPVVDEPMIRACSLLMPRLGGSRLTRIGVTSALRGEGRSTVAIAMAYVQAREYRRPTLLIDADIDAPSLAGRFGLPPGPGLAELLAGLVPVDAALRMVGEGLSVLPAGRIQDPGPRLASQLASSNLLAELQGLFEVVIGDLPALLHSPSAALLAESFGDPLLVVRARVTPVGKVREAVACLPAEPVVLLNGTRSSLPSWLRRFFIH